MTIYTSQLLIGEMVTVKLDVQNYATANIITVAIISSFYLQCETRSIKYNELDLDIHVVCHFKWIRISHVIVFYVISITQ